jgi:hypothetical protein
MWERACSRKRRVSQPLYQLIHPIREHARPHIFSCVHNDDFQKDIYYAYRRCTGR